MRTTARSAWSEERKRKRECVFWREFTGREDEELLQKCACIQKANELKKMESSVFERKFASLLLFRVVLLT